jgi:hypothetical protein
MLRAGIATGVPSKGSAAARSLVPELRYRLALP